MSVHQVRMPRKRFDSRPGLTTLIVAALVTLAVLGFQGKIFDPAPIPEYAFAIFVPSESVARSSRATKIARQAGEDEQPGGAPVLEGEAPPIAEPDAEQTLEEMQSQWVKDNVAYLKSVKRKYMPIGPKPWDRPRFKKATLYVVLEAKQASNTKIMRQVTEELRRITGVVPEVLKGKTDNAKFNLRKGADCGVKAVMTTHKMVDFLNRLNTIILPRIRDFEGLNPIAFDNRGSFSMKFLNQEPFKELDELIDERELVHGFDLCITNSCWSRQDGLKLMKDFGFPFRDKF
mmetsp:Transcript_88878/g.176777  ORF Transcript_88878/g.176777 Transcript_88878/m.176777 type:complete len:289 (-) Transcript_88878:84-950(-)|eukprot:CAMPEP_0172657358 /NCGR_PEP_ID=MMETSP1074-20121228/2040_1 /TAXON_ID=2916 /ORGANISM="Ceratium fusus, Strain PA161109" /LENGTH=288 /DNA_ID=CAMNT_0013472423 /DNA_START=36 /DNA_END=905 /DNA_ORIENTATION=-